MSQAARPTNPDAPSTPRSGPCPDLIAKQRNRDGESSDGNASRHIAALPYEKSHPAALDTTAPAPLPTSSERASVRLLEVEDIADILGMTTDWVYREVRADRLPHIRLGRYVRFRRESIEAWLAASERGAKVSAGTNRPAGAAASRGRHRRTSSHAGHT
jgi:excisionase family DNA binding protein